MKGQKQGLESNKYRKNWRFILIRQFAKFSSSPIFFLIQSLTGKKLRSVYVFASKYISSAIIYTAQYNIVFFNDVH